ncbi:MAG TPA: ATP-binding protein [Polyangiaceae bacterium]
MKSDLNASNIQRPASAQESVSEARLARSGARAQHAGQEGAASYSHELIATLVHDLNNLLTPILAISAGLEQELGGHASHDQAKELRVAAERATLFVQSTLSSLRLRAESAVHIGNVVRDMNDLLRLVAGQRVTLEVDVAPRSGLAMLDRNRLESCLLDLVSNARDAIPARGTIALRVSSTDLDTEQAEALRLPRGSYELVVIEDTGTGIRQDLRERIFERHFTTKTGGKGNGLGLAHVRRFVEESHGAIALNSAPGQRTIFSLYFPRMSPDPLG